MSLILMAARTRAVEATTVCVFIDRTARPWKKRSERLYWREAV